MTDINRGSCFWCGVDVGSDDWDYVGQNRVWVCCESECNKELANEVRQARDERLSNAYEDDFARY